MIERVGDLVAAVLGMRALEPAANLFAIRAAWRDVLGERLAARAQPLRLERGELLVSVPDAVWRQEMSFLTSDIITGLNRALGRAPIERIRLVGSVDLPDEKPPVRTRRLNPRDEIDHGEQADTALAAESTAELPSDIATALAALEQARVGRLRRDRAPDEPAPTSGSPFDPNARERRSISPPRGRS